jgi:hypothetical protein
MGIFKKAFFRRPNRFIAEIEIGGRTKSIHAMAACMSIGMGIHPLKGEVCDGGKKYDVNRGRV